MSHHAQIDENNKVIQVIVTNDNDPNMDSWLVETFGGTWIQTSYNTRGGVHYDPTTDEPDGKEQIRYNFAGIEHFYDPEGDAFHLPEGPYPSWVLDKSTYTWVSPVPKPSDTVSNWNEETQNWDIVPSPYPSWKCVNNVWVAPVPKPPLGNWTWDEDDKMWYPSDPITRKLYA